MHDPLYLFQVVEESFHRGWGALLPASTSVHVLVVVVIVIVVVVFFFESVPYGL